MIGKRLLDIALSAAGLTASAPVLVPVLLATWAQDKHSPFYIADRVARGGGTFRMVKVRSMVMNADKSGVDSTAADDKRITPVGQFVRKFKIDELPQLFNVLRGDMSIVGPRPEQPGMTRRLAAEIPHFEHRLLVKPGITGWAQIHQGYAASVEGSAVKLSHDLYYVRRQSFGLDLDIMIRTAFVMLARIGSR